MDAPLLLIWRPEVDDDPELLHGNSPFEGVELFTFESEEAALDEADRLAELHPTWKFQVETAKPWNA